MASAVMLFAAFVIVAILAYVFGYSHGRSSGKVAAIERLHDVDLSLGGGRDAE